MKKYITVEGAIDLHAHPGPGLFPRPYDDVETAKMSAAAGMQAILLKNHYESTVSRAYYANKLVPDIKIFGGIVLNRCVGGFNPMAVESTLTMGGKEVWMPTIDAAGHVAVYGATGTYQKKGETTSLRPSKNLAHMISSRGLTILKDSEIIPEVKDIIKLVIEYDVILGTSHLTKREISVLVKCAKIMGCKKILITHPYYKPPDLELNEIKELVSLGCIINFCATIVFPPMCTTTVENVKATIDFIGAEHCIITSDAGAAPFPSVPETLRIYTQWLFDRGVSLKNLETMTIKNPKRLLNL